jgi:hypothetical protein
MRTSSPFARAYREKASEQNIFVQYCRAVEIRCSPPRVRLNQEESFDHGLLIGYSYDYNQPACSVWFSRTGANCTVTEKEVKSVISRREALSVISGSVCSAITLPSAAHSASLLQNLPGSTPISGSGKVSGVFSKAQLETVATISELIIPADEHSPGARAARVDEYINDVVGISDAAHKQFWVEGLAAIDQRAVNQHGKGFTACSADQQEAILQELSQAEGHPSTLEERFFVAIKLASVDGYYNSSVGIHQDLQYQGDDVLAEYPGCTHEVHTARETPGSK